MQVMGIDEVLVARIQVGALMAANSLNMPCFTSSFSTTASIIKSTVRLRVKGVLGKLKLG